MTSATGSARSARRSVWQPVTPLRGAIADARAAIAEALAMAAVTGYRIQEIDAMIVDLTIGLAVGDDPAAPAETIRRACGETGYGLGAARLSALVDGADPPWSDVVADGERRDSRPSPR